MLDTVTLSENSARPKPSSHPATRTPVITLAARSNFMESTAVVPYVPQSVDVATNSSRASVGVAPARLIAIAPSTAANEMGSASERAIEEAQLEERARNRRKSRR